MSLFAVYEALRAKVSYSPIAILLVSSVIILSIQSGSAYGEILASDCQLDSSNHPTVVLDRLPFSVIDAGETIDFTGRLVCENGYKHYNVEIIIFEKHFLEDEEIIAIAYTDENGEFSASWLAINRQFDSAVPTTIRAKYQTPPTETGSYFAPVSNKIVFHVKKLSAEISLDPLPASAEIGEMLFFTGKLELSSGNPEGYVVYIKDEDPFESDDLLATAYVESDGSFSANWLVTNTDSDRITDVYAVFEGADIYWRVTTCDIGITNPLGGECRFTIKLQITGIEPIPPPPPPPLPPGPEIIPPPIPPPTTKERLNGDEYQKLYYALDFDKNPVVAIVPSPDSYEKVRGFITPTQEGVMYWTAMLKQKYGGNWDVDFDIIAPGSKFSQKPDVIINLVTRNEKTRCNDVAGWAFVSIFKPVNTVVCAQSYGFFNSKVEVSGTAAHEFIHAMGLGHAYNKIGDLMCSNTCPSGYGKSNQPSDFNLVAVAELYRTDGFRNPNNSVYYDDELTAEEYLQGSSSTTTSIISSTTPPKPPATSIIPPPTSPKPPATTGILLGDYKEFVSNWFGFTIEYPSNWIVDDKVLRDESGFSIVGFTPDGDYTNSIYVLNRQNEPEMVGLTDNSYLRLLKENTKKLVSNC